MKSVELFRLVYEHDGDIVFDFIQQLAFVADEPITLFVQVNVALALWAGQDVEKLLADGHASSSLLPFFRDLPALMCSQLESSHIWIISSIKERKSDDAEVAVDATVGIAGAGV